MAQRSSPRRRKQLVEFGENIRRWRALNGMSAVELADRASVSRQTLRAIEAGEGGRIDSLFSVLGALGIADAAIAGIDPYRNDSARARIERPTTSLTFLWPMVRARRRSSLTGSCMSRRKGSPPT